MTAFDPPGYLSALFIALVIGMAALMIAGVGRAASRRAAALVAVGLLGWLTLTALLAARGFFSDFAALPPRIGAVIVPPVLIVLALTFTPLADRLLRSVPPAWLIVPQSFRIVVEIVLWLLYTHGQIAPLMTFHGRNFDIVAGLSAPLVGWWVARHAPPRSALVLWNVLGLLLVLNVAAHGLLSAPSPFRQFVSDPPFTVVTHFPFVWLPAFLVPLAVLLHGLSLKQMRQADAR